MSLESDVARAEQAHRHLDEHIQDEEAVLGMCKSYNPVLDFQIREKKKKKLAIKDQIHKLRVHSSATTSAP